MLAVCQTRCKEKRFLAAARLPVALSATSSLLFLSRIEQHSAFLAPKLFIFLYLPCWQRTMKVAKPFKLGKQEQGGEMMDGAGRLFVAAASICCSLSLLDKSPVIHCTVTQLWLPCSGLWSWLFSFCVMSYAVWLSCWFPLLFLQVRWLLRYIIAYISYIEIEWQSLRKRCSVSIEWMDVLAKKRG